MKEQNKYPLNIQLFGGGDPAGGADGGAGAPNPQSQTQPSATPEIDYNKLSEVVAGRQANAGDSALKGFFKSQGLTEEQAKEAMTKYKADQAAAKEAEANKYKELETENAKLKAQILNRELDASLTTLAAAEGVDAQKVGRLLKLVEREGLVGEDGKIIDDKAKTAINDVLKDFPEFKSNPNGTGGFQPIGTPGTDGGSGSETRIQDGRIILPSKK
ncbi:hypothetical protein A4S06_05340 [Erysipelotrichaceae bacterium MTC7]|nr:hypothetical protein A4S06_05340 [Erysipelotrichaceae bacterium MTC7]